MSVAIAGASRGGNGTRRVYPTLSILGALVVPVNFVNLPPVPSSAGRAACSESGQPISGEASRRRHGRRICSA